MEEMTLEEWRKKYYELYSEVEAQKTRNEPISHAHCLAEFRQLKRALSSSEAYAEMNIKAERQRKQIVIDEKAILVEEVRFLNNDIKRMLQTRTATGKATILFWFVIGKIWAFFVKETQEVQSE